MNTTEEKKNKKKPLISLDFFRRDDETNEKNKMKYLIDEIDKEIKKLVDVFRFLMKYQILFRGSGVEFAGLREYIPGQDDATKIDWKASLRSKSIYVKQYEEERDLYIQVLLDSSSSMLFGTQKKTKYEYASIIAGSIVYAAIETGDNVGFSIFNEGIKAFLEPTNETTQYYNALRLIVNEENQGGKCNLEKALTHILNTAEPRTILFIISDFIGISETEWKDALTMVRGKIDRIIGIMVRDIRDDELPKNLGYIRVRDPFEEKKIMTVNSDIARFKYEKLAADQIRDVEEKFKSSKAGFFRVYTTDHFVNSLIRYIELSEDIQ